MNYTRGDQLSIAVRDDNTGETGYMKVSELCTQIAETIFEVLDKEKV